MLLLLVQGALAQSPALVEIFKRHFAQLPKSHHYHLRFLMDDGARALRVFKKYGWLEVEEADSSKEADSDGEPPKPTLDPASEEGRKVARQLHTAASELQSVANALQRPPIPPDGFWLKTAQELKKPAARMARLTVDPNNPAIAPLVAQAQNACYECHRTYGGPLNAAELLASGDVDYEAPYPLPRIAATRGNAKKR